METISAGRGSWGHVSQHTCPCLCNVNFVLGPLGRNHVHVYITEGINVDNGKERRNVRKLELQILLRLTRLIFVIAIKKKKKKLLNNYNFFFFAIDYVC